MALKLVPVFLIFLIFWGGGVWYLELEKIAPGPDPPFWDLAQGAWAFLLAHFMALFYKQNSAGENPLVRRVAQRGGDLCM
jgi:hypothetical protein